MNIMLTDFLTDAEIDQAVDLYNEHGQEPHFARMIQHAIIDPNLSRINKAIGDKTGQYENLPRYLAYLIQAAMNTIARRRRG